MDGKWGKRRKFESFLVRSFSGGQNGRVWSPDEDTAENNLIKEVFIEIFPFYC